MSEMQCWWDWYLLDLYSLLLLHIEHIITGEVLIYYCINNANSVGIDLWKILLYVFFWEISGLHLFLSDIFLHPGGFYDEVSEHLYVTVVLSEFCLLNSPLLTLLGRGALQAEVEHHFWGHARSHISGLTPFSPACVSLVPVGSVLSFPLPPVSFHTQHSFEKAKPYTDTETVYLGRVSIIYAVQLFALSHLCLSPPPNLTYFLESRCLTAWFFIQILN